MARADRMDYLNGNWVTKDVGKGKAGYGVIPIDIRLNSLAIYPKEVLGFKDARCVNKS